MSKRSRKESRGDEPERSHSVGKGPNTSKRPCLSRCSPSLAESDMSNQPCLPPEQKRRRRQHLYLVVDDWEGGYSVHRVAEEAFVSDSDAGGLDTCPALSPLVRIEARQPFSLSFAAHGTKILAMRPSLFSPGVPVFDTETLGMTVCPYPPGGVPLGINRPVYATAGGKLLSFDEYNLNVLAPPTEESWAWTCVEQDPPFVSSLASGYAVHPDGRTVFVSADGWSPYAGRVTHSLLKTRKSTFAFDMERLEWTHVGEWLLPFRGRGFYDGELGAWVGLCRSEEGGAGRVCCCYVPPAAAAGCEAAMPAWKLGQDVFFDADREGGHWGATLAYMGDSRFCVVESRVPTDCSLDPSTRLLKMTSFVLKYDRHGDLRTTRRRAYASASYRVAHGEIDLVRNPVAFWM
ncbi:hypothetical protein ACP70R_010958 [Stipagrostis hirtigluma subsp. patula]